MNIGVEIFIQVPAFKTFVYIPRSETAGLNSNAMFNFLRYHRLLSTAAVPFLQQCAKGPQFLYNHPSICCCCCFIFFIIAILMSVKRYLFVVLICTSPMISGVEQLFMCLLAFIPFIFKRWKADRGMVIILAEQGES